MTDHSKTWRPWGLAGKAAWGTSFCKRPSVKVDRDTDDCVMINEKKNIQVAMGGGDNVLVIFYTNDVQKPIFICFADLQKVPPESVFADLVREFHYPRSHVTIAKCNVSENDIPIRVQQSPTITFFPAGKKLTPVEYFGQISNIDHFIQFIEDEGPDERKPVSRRNSPQAQELSSNEDSNNNIRPVGVVDSEVL